MLAYWIGAGNEAVKAYDETEKSYKNLPEYSKSDFRNVIAAYAKGIIERMIIPIKGTEIEYWFMASEKDSQAFMSGKNFASIDNGKGVVNYGKSVVRKGDYYIGLQNYDIRIDLLKLM